MATLDLKALVNFLWAERKSIFQTGVDLLKHLKNVYETDFKPLFFKKEPQSTQSEIKKQEAQKLPIPSKLPKIVKYFLNQNKQEDKDNKLKR